jgi:hypothetical protein
MVIKKKTNLDLANEIKGGDNGVCKNVILAFLQKIGLVSIRFDIESEMSVDISAEELNLLFKREDENFENLERDMDRFLKVVDRSLEKVIDATVKSVKHVIREYNDITEYYELMEEEADRKRERKLKRKSFEMSEDDEESDESPVKD